MTGAERGSGGSRIITPLMLTVSYESFELNIAFSNVQVLGYN
jgi:hypothetical protein